MVSVRIVGQHVICSFMDLLDAIVTCATVFVIYTSLTVISDTTRLSGFYLYVSNSSDVVPDRLTEAHLCYHDNITEPDVLPFYNQTHHCPVVGRYVIFYNKRPADNEPKNLTADNSVKVSAELCEVQVFGK